jgi:hypothetical protein
MLSNIPSELRSSNQWMNYKLKPRPNNPDKLDKIPCDSKGVTQSKTDPDKWHSFENAMSFVDGKLVHGVGYCLNGSDTLVIDLDNCFEPDQTTLKPHAREIVDSVSGFVERSVSGRGLHIFTKTSEQFGNPKNNALGIEVFTDRMFVAMTGNVFESRSEMPPAPVDLSALSKHIRMSPQSSVDTFEVMSRRDPSLSLVDARRIVMDELEPKPDRLDWLNVGMALHFQFEGAPEAFEIWDEYSQREGAGTYESLEVEKAWNSFKAHRSNPITFGSLRARLKASAGLNGRLLAPIDFDISELLAPEYLLEGYFPEGIASVAGQRGAGKSQMIVHLAAIVSHLIKDPISPPERRKVYYFTEQADQIQRILYGLTRFGGGEFGSEGLLLAGNKEVNSWLHIIPTQKMTAADVAHHIAEYGCVGTVLDDQGIEVAPWLIFDTASATFEIEDENSNSEWSRFIASVRQSSRRSNPCVWIVTHTAKGANNGKTENITARGASALESDVSTAAVIQRDVGSSQTTMLLTKTRIQTEHNVLTYTTTPHFEVLKNKRGRLCEVRFDVGRFELTTLKDQKAGAAKQVRDTKMGELKGKIYELIAANDGELNVDSIRNEIRGNNGDTSAALKQLENDGLIRSIQQDSDKRKRVFVLIDQDLKVSPISPNSRPRTRWARTEIGGEAQ